jgi:hypothetical protein
LAPVLLAFGMVVAPDSINLWTWPLLMLFALRIAKGGDPRLWLAAGGGGSRRQREIFGNIPGRGARGRIVAGATTACASDAVVRRRAALAAAMFLPNSLWQAMHGFPMLELLHNGQLGKNVVLSPLEFVVVK